MPFIEVNIFSLRGKSKHLSRSRAGTQDDMFLLVDVVRLFPRNHTGCWISGIFRYLLDRGWNLRSVVRLFIEDWLWECTLYIKRIRSEWSQN